MKVSPRTLFIFVICLIVLLVIIAILLFATNPKMPVTNVSSAAIAKLVLFTTNKQLDHLVDASTIFSERLRFRDYIAADQWEKSLHYTPNPMFDTTLQPYLDRVILTDQTGQLMAATPPYTPPVANDFSSRDWYGGGIGSSSVYLSSAYKKIATPQSIVIGISLPIESPVYENRTLGRVILQFSVNYFSDWINSVTSVTGRKIYLIDQRNQIVTGSDVDAQQPIVTIATSSMTQGILYGQPTTFLSLDPYGWKIAVQK